MKKFLSVVSLLMALMMLCTSALANEQKYDEPVTVHFVRSTDDTLDANYFSQHPDKTMTDNLWCDLFRDELNINVEYDWIVKSGDEYDQKLAAELAVGAIPEFVNVTALQAKQLYEAGLIMPLDEIYNEYATEQTKRVMLETGTSPFDAVTFDGQLYALPVVGETLMIADLMWIRTDWLEKLNLPVPTTMDELIATAKAFAEADFDGNGVNDTIGMAVSKTPWDQLFTLKGFFNAFDSYPEIWVDDGTGKLVYGSTLPVPRTRWRRCIRCMWTVCWILNLPLRTTARWRKRPLPASAASCLAHSGTLFTPCRTAKTLNPKDSGRRSPS